MMAHTGKATSARAGSIRLPAEGVARLARRVGATLLKLTVVMMFAAPAWGQQAFTGGPFVFPANSGGVNTITRQTVPVTVSVASAIKSISVPLGFGGSPEFQVMSQTGCVIDGVTVNAAGSVCSVVVRFSAQAPGLRSAQLHVIDGSGTATNLGLSGMGFIAQAGIFPAVATVLAGTGPTGSGYAGDGGVATAAVLHAPEGVATDAFGNVYVADTANNVVRMLDAFGNITTVVGTGAPGYTGDGEIATAATLQGPTWLAVDTAQNLYIADSGNNVIRKVALSGSGVITTVAGTGTAGFSGDGEAAGLAKLSGPQGIVVDPAGNLYIVDSGNNRLRKVDAVTRVMTTIAGQSEAGFDAGDVAPMAAHFHSPMGVALDAAGNIYVADAGNHVVRELTASGGKVVLYAGTGTAGRTGNGGAATSALLYGPTGLALNAAGDLFISDTGNDVLRRVERSSGTIDLYLGQSKSGYGTGLKPSNQVGLSGPMGLALDASQNLIVSDSANNVVRRASPFAGSVQFSATAVGQTTADQTVMVSNIGTADLHFAGLPFTLANSATTANFNVTTTGATSCGGTLVVGAHCVFAVNFAPQAAGFVAGEVDAHDNSLAPAVTTVVQPVYLLGGLMQDITMTPTTLPDAPPNVAYSTTVTAAGGFGALTLEEVGTLPAGITGAIAGRTITFSGTPTTNGTYPFTVFATDVLGNSVAQALSIKVVPAPIVLNVAEVIQESDSPNEVLSVMVNVTEAIGVQDAPAVLPTITLGVVEAIQAADSPVVLPTLTVSVTEAIQTTDSPDEQVLLTLTPPSGSLAVGTLGAAYSATFRAIGGSGSYAFSSAGGIPPGLTLVASGSSYVLSGTPTLPGNYSFTVTLNDGQVAPVTNSYGLVVSMATQTITVGALPTLTYGGGVFTVPVSASSGLPVTLTVMSGPASGASPFTITGAGTVMFHATQAGNATYASTSMDFGVVINPAMLTVTADSFSRVFGVVNPPLTYQVSGYVLGQGVGVLSGTAVLTVKAPGTAVAGAYPIRVSAGTLAADNYSFTFVPGTLTVLPSSGTQTITFGAIPNLPVGVTMHLTARASSGLEVMYEVAGPATLSGSTVTATGFGVVTVTARQPGNGSYAAAPSVSRSFIPQ